MSPKGKPNNKLDENTLKRAIEHHQQGRFQQAVDIYNSILDLEPSNHSVLHLVGQAMLGRHQPGDLEHSIELLKRAIALDDNRSAYHNDLGTALWNQRNINSASDCFDRALEIEPDFIQAHFNLGNCFWFQGDIESAADSYVRVLALNASWEQARYMLANCLLCLGKSREALTHYNAINKNPALQINAMFGKSAALLRLGNWKAGWKCYEARLQTETLNTYRQSKRPQWEGQQSPDSRLLIYAEQGLGDLIMFVRFLHNVQPWVKQIILVCDDRLHRLLSNAFPDVLLVDKKTVSTDIDTLTFDYKVSIMSLGFILGVEPEDIPNQSPYLFPCIEDVKPWSERIDSSKFNVGVVWAGNPSQKDDRFRSFPMELYFPLHGIDGVQLYSLQKDQVKENQIEFNQPANLIGKAHDLADTAALISTLDLIITVDTAVAHLAGALGKPVWNLLWLGHCWRYLDNRTDSPWYPTMRLFKQSELGRWDVVINQVFAALVREVEKFKTASNAIE